ncbi:hypothetical protein AN642_00340 [Epulopiscium sp. SCG-B10WGA-EpuloA2]|nr:hypothetical protein AN642_00325 [Epulopiscium sp. SCG-B10WGA-EpuloA2]ONI44775.1 hypothetical protein AN642_00340 [Epulopiscium sp. SCG-B10WGA-EpuloA2]
MRLPESSEFARRLPYHLRLSYQLSLAEKNQYLRKQNPPTGDRSSGKKETPVASGQFSDMQPKTLSYEYFVFFSLN